MYVLKPSWVSHSQRSSIFSVDIHPDGTRFVTAGADHKIRIWNFILIIDAKAAVDPSLPRSLAVITDHFGPVNCVRWSPGGHYLASGSDDRLIFVHKLSPGKRTVQFGSNEPADVENWKLERTFRGHVADVVQHSIPAWRPVVVPGVSRTAVDLAWSPDSIHIVSCSLDCSVRVWHAATGVQVASLDGHESLVKGVAWDPIGSFIASQSDDKTVRVWQTRDWSLVTKLEGYFGKTTGSPIYWLGSHGCQVGATFFRRLDWSPCGSFLTATHAFADPQHTAAVIDRTDWSKDFDFVGHGAPVVAVRYNSSLFRMPPSSDSHKDGKKTNETVAGTDTTMLNNKEEENEAVKKGDQSTGEVKDKTTKVPSKKREGQQDGPYHCLAIGSQDCQLTVWASNRSKPVMIGKHFFQQPVVDLAWSPDGYTLLACSTDGCLSAFIFGPKEIGVPLSAQEMDAMKLERYGKVRGGQAPIAESADLISLSKHSAASPSVGNSQKTAPMLEWTVPVTAAGTESASGQAPIQTAVSKPEEQQVQKPDATVGTPLRQIETRRADGRRRIVPQAVAGPTVRSAPAGPQAAPSVAPGPTGEVPSGLSGGVNRVSDNQPAGKERHAEAAPERDGGTRNEFAKRPRTSGEGLRSPLSTRIESVRSKNTVFVCGATDLQGRDVIASHPIGPTMSVTVAEEGHGHPFVLEARREDSGTMSSSGASLRCTQMGSLIWKDTMASSTVALAGSPFFWAVGSKDGNLQVYTKGGRRALPLICLGSPAALMATDSAWRLLVVTRRGNVQLWDLQSSLCLLQETAASLLATARATAPLAVSSARITGSGSVLLCLQSGQAFLFHPAMKSWLCVAQDSFPLSEFASSWPPSPSGALAEAQAALRQRRADGPLFASTVASLVGRGREEEKEQTRGHLEDQIANCAALRSEDEYRQWLLAYVRHLTREGDEGRLREVCQELLGPPTNDPSQLALIGWQPVKLGLVRRRFLRAEVLPAMASNLSIQRLAQEYLELLKDIEDG